MMKMKSTRENLMEFNFSAALVAFLESIPALIEGVNNQFSYQVVDEITTGQRDMYGGMEDMYGYTLSNED